ncbi:hypothetical protein [Litorivivens sp.]|uniref:hypothetical protein n=1 Tax=Litorivivens sp. TaxID=2020868 RepID=UPI0035669B66
MRSELTTSTALQQQLVFGLSVASTLLIMGLWLNTTGEAGSAAVLTGVLLATMNTAQYLMRSGKAARLSNAATKMNNSVRGDTL